VGRHSAIKPRRKSSPAVAALIGSARALKPRRKSSPALAALIGSAAALFAVGADMHPQAKTPTAEPVAAVVGQCCAEVVALAPGTAPLRTIVQNDQRPADVAMLAASRLRLVPNPQLLPAGKAPERGLQVKTILTARSVSAVFPEIQSMGGVRPDALRWHPNGLALDVMIPDPTSAAGIALGDQIVAYVMKNVERFAIQDAIWRGTYYTPGGRRAGGYGHYDHVHITTKGGGYPTGSEQYFR
jgi:hypothetical protein